MQARSREGSKPFSWEKRRSQSLLEDRATKCLGFPAVLCYNQSKWLKAKRSSHSTVCPRHSPDTEGLNFSSSQVAFWPLLM